MSGHPETRVEEVSDAVKVPHSGTIYDRLEKARARRRRALSPLEPANDIAPTSEQTSIKPAQSKLRLLPEIKPQEAFDPPAEINTSSFALRLGIGLIALSVIAGFTLANWGGNTPQTKIVAPSMPKSDHAQTDTSLPDTKTLTAQVPILPNATNETLPAVPAGPEESPNVQLQQDILPLSAPTAVADRP